MSLGAIHGDLQYGLWVSPGVVGCRCQCWSSGGAPPREKGHVDAPKPTISGLAVFGDGPVAGQTILVQGVLGGVGSLAARFATWVGATVIGAVRPPVDLALVPIPAAAHAVALDLPFQ